MFLNEQLTEIARRKGLLRQSIARRRAECKSEIAVASQPLAWFDRARQFWSHLTPIVETFAGAASGLAADRSSPRLKFAAAFARWAPVLFKHFNPFRRTRGSTSVPSGNG